MPRNVRNFWITLNVDGRETAIETGPRAKDGGFRLTVKMRDQGGIIRPLEVAGQVTADGRLHLTLGGEIVAHAETAKVPVTFTTYRDTPRDWEECACCGMEHPRGFSGDCRTDGTRRPSSASV